MSRLIRLHYGATGIVLVNPAAITSVDADTGLTRIFLCDGREVKVRETLDGVERAVASAMLPAAPFSSEGL